MKKILFAAMTAILLLAATGCKDIMMGPNHGGGDDSYITFKGNDAFTLGINTTIGASKAWDGTVEYSTDKKNWTVWDGSKINSASSDGNNYIYLRGKDNTHFANSMTTITVFELGGSAKEVECTGNIMTLLNYSSPDTAKMADGCFMGLFLGCNKLTKAPDLPATTLTIACYYAMFGNCTLLKAAPALPATTLATNCYSDMFEGCTALKAAPDLPATTLADHCYDGMFNGCTSLTTAPALPATTLATACYSSMFRGCTSLTTFPSLPATTLADTCYASMFLGCTALATAPNLSVTTLKKECYSNMFNGCTQLKTSPALPATKLEEKCYEYMFAGCSALSSAGKIADGIQVNTETDCFHSMFASCSSLKVDKTTAGNHFVSIGTMTTTGDAGDMFDSTGGSFKGHGQANTAYKYD